MYIWFASHKSRDLIFWNLEREDFFFFASCKEETGVHKRRQNIYISSAVCWIFSSDWQTNGINSSSSWSGVSSSTRNSTKNREARCVLMQSIIWSDMSIVSMWREVFRANSGDQTRPTGWKVFNRSTRKRHFCVMISLKRSQWLSDFLNQDKLMLRARPIKLLS